MPKPQAKTIAQYDQLIEAWPTATSFDDAFTKANLSHLKDRRNKQRLRRNAEQYRGVVLESHNPEHSTEHETLCPSDLDIQKAKQAKGFICSAYMNNTTLINPFLDALEHFSKYYSYQILTKAVRYHNPNAMTRSEPYVWNKRIIPYVINEDFHINPSIVFSGVSLQATAANPVAGKQIAYGKKSVIYGASSLELESVATPKDKLPKLMFATGSLNKPRYSNSDAGIKAVSKHKPTAILIIPVGNYNRDYILEWDGTGFSFFGQYWTADGLHEEPARYAALHLGDVHAEGVTPAIVKQRQRLIEHTDPRMIIWNDLHNHGSASHHNTLIENMIREKLGTRSVREEIQLSVDLVNKLGKGRKNLIVGSNHHDHIEQWLGKFNPKHDIANAEYYFWIMNEIATNPGMCALELAMRGGLEVDYEFTSGDKEYDVAGIDCSQHGHRGADGARSAVAMHKLSYPLQTGHVHKRTIKHNHWTSGVLPLELGYNKGYGTWSSTDTLISETGTRAHITFINGKYWK